MEPRLRSLRPHALGLILGLVIQYALGMYVNLFVTFPDGANQGQLWEFAWSQPSLASHIILAFLLLFGAIALCIRAIRAKNKKWIIASTLSLLALLGAGASGATFIPSQTDVYSYSMALCFLIAIFAYIWGLFAVPNYE
jgi:hypothetical protein